jgi:DNA repair exonuclease SbcCD ATPase subunit
VKELEDINLQQRKKITELAAKLELAAAPSAPNSRSVPRGSSAATKPGEDPLLEKELLRLRERNRYLENALERKGRRESQMIVQLQQLEIRERERDESERRTREYEAVCAEWARKDALRCQELDRLKSALAEEARRHQEEHDREQAKTKRMVQDLEALEAQLERLRAGQADRQRLEARAREFDIHRATLEARVADLEARLRDEGRSESDVVAELRAVLDEVEQRYADLTTQASLANLDRDTLQAQIQVLQRQLDQNANQARDHISHLQTQLAEARQVIAPRKEHPILCIDPAVPSQAASATAPTVGEAPVPARSVSDRCTTISLLSSSETAQTERPLLTHTYLLCCIGMTGPSTKETGSLR